MHLEVTLVHEEACEHITIHTFLVATQVPFLTPTHIIFMLSRTYSFEQGSGIGSLITDQLVCNNLTHLAVP